MSFAKAFFSSCLGALAAMILFFVLTLIFFSALVSGLSSEQEVIVESNSVLHLKLDGQIRELQQENPLAGLPVPGGDAQSVGLLQLKEALAHAKSDDNIKGIYLEASYPMTGFSTLEEIRESLIDFRKSGKWVV